MTVNSITSNDTTANSGQSASSDTVSGNSTLNQADFLQLLVAQIQYQDPMNPQSDTDMAAQLAQYSALQQSTASAGSLAMMQADSLVGSTVTVQVDSTSTASGVVSGVVMSNGSPQITVGGTNYALSQINSVTPPAANSSTSSNSGTSSANTQTSQ
jgi:flagellar basal-body rod modification protein FlgD